jgi:DNA replication protein DnaC
MTQYLTGCGYRGENPQVYDAIREYGAAEEEGKNTKGLFLRGACGIGKSYGVFCLAAKFQWPVISAKQLQAAFMSYSDDAFLRLVDGVDEFDRPHTIVIDDIGTEDCPVMKYGTATNMIADVLDRRYYMGFHRHNVRTIVTCNLSDEQLRERYGLRIDDRMNEIFKFATVNGKSLRQ